MQKWYKDKNTPIFPDWIRFCKSHNRKSLCVITCKIASSKDTKEFCYSPLNCLHDVWFYQLRHRLHDRVFESTNVLVHFNRRWKSENPSFSWWREIFWWSSILYHRVANANRYLYILVLILPELVIDCLEL